jgi:cell division protein FtsI/penicillin-binding protein 2
MAFSKKSPSRRNRHRSWRDYQASLPKKSARKPRSQRRSGLSLFSVGLCALVVLGGLFGFIHNSEAPPDSVAASTAEMAPAQALTRDQVRQLLDERMFSNLQKKDLALPIDGGTLHVETTLDPDLQNYLLGTIDRVNSRYVGIVVMEALSGRVLALAGYDRNDEASNPCLRSQYPAASVFKIVTAAAAIDQCGYTADSPVCFNGAKHTLYKRQLTDKVTRYTTTIPLREAFADSVNPVFGKLGELRLGKPLLEQAAASFGFNQPLDFDLSLPPSRFQISDLPYNWAEVASGFNRKTTLSPLHGAAMAAAVINGGQMVSQTIVERIADDQGQVLYRRPPTPEAHRIMSARAAAALERMMEDTVTSGTASKFFRGHRKDKILAPLRIGGKTGSIGGPAREVRYEWFVGFARESQGEKQLVVAVMVGHEEFLGIRASDYARRAMTYYFKASAASDTATAESGAGEGNREG